MCGDMGEPSWTKATLLWRGWKTDLPTLFQYGWQVEWRQMCKKDARGKPLYVIGTRIYLTHPRTGVLARFSVMQKCPKDVTPETFYTNVYGLDFLLYRKQLWRSSIKVREVASSYGVEDIPVLLDIITELQTQYPKTKRKKKLEELPMAEIIQLVA